MKYGINVPNFGDYGEPRVIAELARDAEAAGWDGFFIWDHMTGGEWTRMPMTDPWITLAAAAMTTERIRLGPMVTPVARRRPWKLARETVALDRLSNGRLILGVGLGFPPDGEFSNFGEDADDRVRAAKLDEGLDVLTRLWSGERVDFDGSHLHVHTDGFHPAPIQTSRIPVWVAGMTPARAPLRRAARWDGVFPINGPDGAPMSPGMLRETVAYVKKHRTSDQPFDVVIGGETSADPGQVANVVAPFEDAGTTWWMEGINGWRGTLDENRARIRSGPPR